MAEKHTLTPVFGTEGREQQLLDPKIWDRFSGLDQGGKIAAE